MLETLTLDAEACCWKHFVKAGIKGNLESVTAWECPVCEQEYLPRTEGAVRYWEAKAWAVKL